jgi:hypothetical protein
MLHELDGFLVAIVRLSRLFAARVPRSIARIFDMAVCSYREGEEKPHNLLQGIYGVHGLHGF